MANKPENTYVITAGSKPIYEVEKSEDGTKVTIRFAENHENKFELAASVVPELINALQKLAPYN